jgi:hypothetical protein
MVDFGICSVEAKHLVPQYQLLLAVNTTSSSDKEKLTVSYL